MFLYFVVSVLQVSAGGLNPAAQTSTFCRESIPIAEKDHADLGSYYLSKNARSSGSKTFRIYQKQLPEYLRPEFFPVWKPGTDWEFLSYLVVSSAEFLPEKLFPVPPLRIMRIMAFFSTSANSLYE